MLEELFRIRLKNEQILFLAIFITLIIALVDFFALPKFVVSLAYIAPIFLASFSYKQNLVYKFSALCGLLVILPLFISPDLISLTQIINRVIIASAIFLITGIIAQHRYYENKFLQIIEAAPVANLVVDNKGRILLMNQESQRLFGYERKELLGQSVDLLVPQRFRSKHPDYRQGFFTNPEKRFMGVGRDLFGLRQDGSEFPVEIGLNPLLTKEGFFVLAVVIDISERKKQENAITVKNKELETLLHIASHDLKEPLRAMEYFSSLVNERYNEKLDDKGKVFLSKIVASSAYMAKLLDDLSLMSKASNMEYYTQKVKLQDILQEVLMRLENKIKDTKAQIYVAENLPDVYVNKVWFMEAVCNLVSNALKFTKAGEAPDIEIDIYDKDLLPHEMALVVRDRGPGVNLEYAEKIFQLFQRAVHKDVEGTGTGLAIVKSIAEGHGGRAWVQKRSSGGSEFVLTFRKIMEEAKV